MLFFQAGLLMLAVLSVHGLLMDAAGHASRTNSAGSAGRGAASQCSQRRSATDTWDYRDGGASWDLGQCCEGQGQSPLNVTAAMAVQTDGKLLFHGYHRVENPVTMVNDGKVLSASMEPFFGGISLGSHYPTGLTQKWELWKIVVHTPSEHTFQGVQVPLELQLFHRQTGTLDDPPPPEAVAVVAVGFQISPQSSGFLHALSQGGLPKVKGGETQVNRAGPAMLDFTELFTQAPAPGAGAAAYGAPAIASVVASSNGDVHRGHFWHYFGSETAPPCRTGLQYFVRHDPLPATTLQVDRFKEAVHAIAPFRLKSEGNARRLQPACGRTTMLRATQDVSMLMDMHQKVPDQSFEKALDNAASQQEEFESAMSTPAPQYMDCIADLGAARNNLGIAKDRQKMECEAVDKEMRDFEASGSGINRLAAGEQLHGQQSLCETQTKVVEALEAEVKMDREKCNRLRLTTGTGTG